MRNSPNSNSPRALSWMMSKRHLMNFGSPMRTSFVIGEPSRVIRIPLSCFAVQPVHLAAGDLDAAKLEADLLQARLRMLLGVEHDNAVALPVVAEPSAFDEARRLLQHWDQ